MIKLDLSNLTTTIDFASYAEKVKEINHMINEKTGAGNDFLGWTTWPSRGCRVTITRLFSRSRARSA